MNNTMSRIRLQLVQSEDPVVVYYSDECSVTNATSIHCSLPSEGASDAVTEFGEYLISVVESGTNLRLNDENLLSILVLPRPAV